MILIKETILQFGYDPAILKPKSGKKIVCACDSCGKQSIRTMADNSRISGLCHPCSLKKAHTDLNSGFNSQEYKNKRSEIASRSNKNRKISSIKFKKYLPYLEKLKNGEISFVEIAKELGMDDSTVCKFFHSNFKIRSKINYSIQEREVGQLLKQLIPDIKEQVRYSKESKHKSDWYSKDFGYIEYDGNGFFHIKNSDKHIDSIYNPIRLNAQAWIGGLDYLNWKLFNKKTGYINIKDLKEYSVLKIDNRKESTKMLENCHPLGNCSGTIVFGLFWSKKLIGVAKFGVPTNKIDNGCLELRRFFVLDGTPKNTESFFLRQCEKQLQGRLVTYIHDHEKGSYLKALGWIQNPKKNKNYDTYLIDGKIINKRKMWGWAKKIGLIDKFGTTQGKELLMYLLDGKKIIEPSKIKFTKDLKS